MVCVPCFIIPVLLFIWHRFIQPILLKYWNPWEKKDKDGNVIKSGTEFPFECAGGACPFPMKKNTTPIEAVAEQQNLVNNAKLEPEPNKKDD
jgi:hypothetical protein